ncbi:MAG: hypothetical protein J7463_05130 [Roseiflexus sp.]|nr:hypothetical protein [Roseiflexus sp.]MBO9333573.1 hypothetical protein [Roseiflexus sp.]MBO9363372.1 hypothetical protein [Roseiflexus sp.]MBO9380970.1 hypothetical protein [Roseiflexus sp.]MBO9387833.1 hypothetical protein [Roseiflexus sp.]
MNHPLEMERRTDGGGRQRRAGYMAMRPSGARGARRPGREIQIAAALVYHYDCIGRMGVQAEAEGSACRLVALGSVQRCLLRDQPRRMMAWSRVGCATGWLGYCWFPQAM